MAKTIKELMAEAGLEDTASAGQTKQASASAPISEVDQVLADLGLSSTETVKTASEQTNGKEENTMSSMQDLYGHIFGDDAPAAAGETTKVASAEGTVEQSTETAPVEGEMEKAADGRRTLFGELTASYFNEMVGPYAEELEKSAGDLEAEAGKGETALEHIQPQGGMTSVLGKPGEPRLPMNHSASSGEKIHATTKGSTPYSLKGPAMKEILKRLSGAAPGGSYEQ